MSTAVFDASTRWERSPKIGLRPEPFGALAYHFDTRRLVFLKSPTLVDLVEALADHDSAEAAIEAIALGHENVVRFTDGKTVRKVIVVPGRLVNANLRRGLTATQRHVTPASLAPTHATLPLAEA